MLKVKAAICTAGLIGTMACSQSVTNDSPNEVDTPVCQKLDEEACLANTSCSAVHGTAESDARF